MLRRWELGDQPSAWRPACNPRPREGRPILILYEHPFALYCQKVLVALNELGVAYDVLEEQRDFDRATLAELWPPASIPVLRDGDEVVGETSIIIEHVAGRTLVPSLEARKWDRLCDQYISNAVQAIVADTIEERFDKRAVSQARGRLDMAYAMLETQLTQHEFLAGESFTIADCAAAPGLFFALAIHPWDEGTQPQLTRYYRALAHRPSFAKVIADARPYRELFPLPWPRDFDRYH
jgi:glutathione S-transferase